MVRPSADDGGAGASTGGPGDGPNMQLVTIRTPRGPIDVLYDLQIDGKTLHLKDIAVYPRQAQPQTGVLRELLSARAQIAKYAKEAGYDKLRITGYRTLRSTSARPGKLIDVTIDLSTWPEG